MEQSPSEILLACGAESKSGAAQARLQRNSGRSDWFKRWSQIPRPPMTVVIAAPSHARVGA